MQWSRVSRPSSSTTTSKNTEAGNIKFEKSEFGKIVKTESEYPFGKTEALKTEPVRIEAEHTEADKATFENSE